MNLMREVRVQLVGFGADFGGLVAKTIESPGQHVVPAEDPGITAVQDRMPHRPRTNRRYESRRQLGFQHPNQILFGPVFHILSPFRGNGFRHELVGVLKSPFGAQVRISGTVSTNSRRYNPGCLQHLLELFRFSKNNSTVFPWPGACRR